jgi:hypothetical protein
MGVGRVDGYLAVSGERVDEPVFSSGRIWRWTPVLAARPENRLCVEDILLEGTLNCDAINDLDVPDLWLDL